MDCSCSVCSQVTYYGRTPILILLNSILREKQHKGNLNVRAKIDLQSARNIEF